jgi:pyridoxal phosphate enzyme (YggS family)
MPHQSVAAVRARIAESARISERHLDDIRLLAVSKGRSIDQILRLHDGGILDFAENRSTDLNEKARHPALKTVRWHFIGELQLEQCPVIAASAHAVHSLYRADSADALSKTFLDVIRGLDVFLQVNLVSDARKSGVDCSRWEEDHTQVSELLALAKHVGRLPGLTCVGLMTIAPPGLPERDLRAVFARARSLLGATRTLEPTVGASLSMGMSSDFELAIEEGATHIRLGSILFD